jgi:Rad3-related DNA helicase
VNQALGRAVRHEFDYGSIILIDSRYEYSKMPDYGKIKKNISNWIKNSW